MSREVGGEPSSENVSKNLPTMNVSLESDRHKVYLTIARKITTNHDATTMGIILGIKPDDVTYYVNKCDIRHAAYRFLSWMEDKYGPVEKWEKIIEALKVLEKNTAVKELGLEKRLEEATRDASVHNSSPENRQAVHCRAKHKNSPVDVEENLYKIRKAEPEESDRHKVFLTIARKMTTNHDAMTLGITLGRSPDDVTYNVNKCDVRDATYMFLSWTEDNYGPVEKWEKIIEALRVLGKNTTITEFDLEERLATAKRSKSVQNSANEQNEGSE